MQLPDADTNARSGSTALAVAIGGVICPVPFVMSVAAIRIAGNPREQGRSKAARFAFGLAVLTMVGQAALVVLLVAGTL